MPTIYDKTTQNGDRTMTAKHTETLVELLTEAKKYLKERSYTWQEIDVLCSKIDTAIGEA